MPRRTKGQHFLLTAAARTLSLTTVLRLSDTEAETVFAAVRWSETNGRPVCPACDCDAVYDCCRPSGAPRWRCKRCRKDFSLTSGTLFAFHKLALRIYLAAVVIFVNEVKGKGALPLSRDLGVQYKTAFVLAHKIREAMAAESCGVVIGGAGKTAEIDGAYFGGHIRPENRKEDRQDRRLAINQTGKRRCVVTIRERDGRTLTDVFPSEDAAGTFIRTRIAKGTEVHADEASAWNDLHARYPMHRVSTTRTPTARIALAPTGRSPSSRASAAGRSGTIITSRASTCTATPRKPPSGKTTAGPATASSSVPSSHW